MADGADSSAHSFQRTRQQFEQAAAGLRVRLRFFFRRRCTRSDEADSVEDCIQETLLRVARRIDAGEEIVNLEACAVETAKFVFLEFVHRISTERNRRQPTTEEVNPLDGLVAAMPDEELEARTDCLSRCLLTLSSDQRSLIVSWFAEPFGSAKIDQHRRLTESHAVPASTLRVRVFRLINRLRKCCADCVELEATGNIVDFVGRGRVESGPDVKKQP